MNKASAVSEMSTPKRAEKVKTQAREVVELLEQARELMVEENAVQLAVEHLNAALREAEGWAAVLENWYQRTYSPVPESLRRPLYCGGSGRLDASQLSPPPSARTRDFEALEAAENAVMAVES